MTTDLTILKEIDLDLHVKKDDNVTLTYIKHAQASPDAVVVRTEQVVLDHVPVDKDMHCDRAIIFRMCSPENGIEDSIGGAFIKSVKGWA